MSDDPEFVDAFQGASVADLDWHRRQQEGLQEVPELDSWTPRNLAEIEDAPPVEPTLGGLGLVYPGKRHVFSGPQESAKTLAAYVVGLHVVRAGGKAVLIDFEMGPWDAKRRLQELGATADELGAFLYVDPNAPASPASIGAIVDMEPQLVLVDAAAGAFALENLDDNARKDVERWANAWIDPFWKAGIATIVLDHVTKNAETRGSYAIGSERKVGQADVHLGFTTVRPISRGDHGLYRITTHKDRGGCLKRGHLAEFKLTSDPETHRISWEFVSPQDVDDTHPFRPTVLMEKVSRYLEQQQVAIPMSQIEKEVTGKGEWIRKAVSLMVEEGYISESEGRRSARLMLSVRAYRESSDDLVPTSSHLVPNMAETDLVPRPYPLRGDEDADGVNGTGTSSSRGAIQEIPF